MNGPTPPVTPARRTASAGTALERTEPSALAAVVETSTAAAAQMARSAIESRFIMARQYPRTWDDVRARVLEACRRPRFAEEARYALPRGEKKIEGLSVRFAEEAMRAMGNMIVESHVVFDDAERRTVTVSVTDLETNVTWPADVVVEKFVERRGKGGGEREVVGTRTNADVILLYRVRTTDDELLMKQNSLVSKAARNGILRFLPSDIQEEALAAVAKTMEKPEAKDVRRMEQAFARLSVDRAALEGFLGHPLTEVTAAEYAHLSGVGNAIKDGETTWEQVIATVPATARQAPRPVREANYGQPVKAEVQDMATKPVGRTEPRTSGPDDYHCAHGVALTDRCDQCAAEYGGA
jgi:hypothetical protein